MADQADVEKGIVTRVAGILYPNGLIGSPPPSIIGKPARIERGWPDQKQLDADLLTGVFNVSVFSRPNMERPSTRYPTGAQEGAISPTTYALVQAGQVVSVTGAPPATYYPQNLCLFVGGVPFVYQAQAGDSAAQVAAGLAALLSVGLAGVSVAGPAITLPTTAVIGALRVGSTGQVISEVGRQEKQFCITFWCPDPDTRDAAVGVVDANLRSSSTLALADGSAGHLVYRGSNTFDAPQKELLYRRELLVTVDYPTTLITTAAQLVAMQTETDRAQDGALISKTYT